MPKVEGLITEKKDGTKLCFMCKRFKGHSFFAPAEWKRKGFKRCIACNKKELIRYNKGK